MNQIIVILVVIKKWFKLIKPNFVNIIILSLALSGAVYTYVIYNNIQDQNLKFNYSVSSGCKVDSSEIKISLDYASLEKKMIFNVNSWQNEQLETNVRVKSYISKIDTTNLNITSDSLYSWFIDTEEVWGSKHQMDAFTTFSEKFHGSHIMVSSSLKYTYEDNSWLFIRTKGNKLANSKDNIEKQLIESDTANMLLVRMTDYIESSDSYDVYIGRKKKLLKYNYVNTYLFDTQKQASNKELTIVDQYEVAKGVYKPSIFNAYDISKIKLHFDFLQIAPNSKLEIDFLDLMELTNACPVPDNITSQGFEYFDKDKIDYISKHGIDCFVKFPKAENFQTVRNYILSALITLMFTFLCTILWRTIKINYKERKRHNKIRNSLLETGHKQLYFMFCKQRLLSNIVVGLLVSVLIYLLSPYRGFAVYLLIALYVALLIPITAYGQCFFLAAKKKLVTKEEYKSYQKKIIKIALLSSPIWGILSSLSIYGYIEDKVFLIFLSVFLTISFIIGALAGHVISKLYISAFYKNIERGSINKFNKICFIVISVILVLELIFYFANYKFSKGVILVTIVLLCYYFYILYKTYK